MFLIKSGFNKETNKWILMRNIFEAKVYGFWDKKKKVLILRLDSLIRY